jgi:hypothetical protein
MIKHKIPANEFEEKFQFETTFNYDHLFSFIFSSFSISIYKEKATDKHLYTIHYTTLEDFKLGFSKFTSYDFSKVLLTYFFILFLFILYTRESILIIIG